MPIRSHRCPAMPSMYECMNKCPNNGSNGSDASNHHYHKGCGLVAVPGCSAPGPESFRPGLLCLLVQSCRLRHHVCIVWQYTENVNLWVGLWMPGLCARGFGRRRRGGGAGAHPLRLIGDGIVGLGLRQIPIPSFRVRMFRGDGAHCLELG